MSPQQGTKVQAHCHAPSPQASLSSTSCLLPGAKQCTGQFAIYREQGSVERIRQGSVGLLMGEQFLSAWGAEKRPGVRVRRTQMAP